MGYSILSVVDSILRGLLMISHSSCPDIDGGSAMNSHSGGASLGTSGSIDSVTRAALGACSNHYEYCHTYLIIVLSL